MYSFDELPVLLRDRFRLREDFQDCVFLCEFPVTLKKTPLYCPVIAFGLEGIDIGLPEDINGLPIIDSHKLGRDRFRFSIHVPRHQGGELCHSVLARLCRALLFESELELTSLSCQGIVYDRDSDSLILKGQFTLEESINSQ